MTHEGKKTFNIFRGMDVPWCSAVIDGDGHPCVGEDCAGCSNVICTRAPGHTGKHIGMVSDAMAADRLTNTSGYRRQRRRHGPRRWMSKRARRRWTLAVARAPWRPMEGT